MYIGHVGDSRCYRVREGHIQLLTRDHSLINDYLLAMPDLTDEQKSELPEERHHARARACRTTSSSTCSTTIREPGDVYVLCSDGLSGMVSDDDIEQIVTIAPDIREACRKLIQRANERGGEDNITAVLIQIEEPDRDVDQRRGRRPQARRERRELSRESSRRARRLDAALAAA